MVNSITEDLLLSVKEKSEYIKEKLLSTKNVVSISGKGLMLGIEINGEARTVIELCKEKGLIVLSAKQKIRLLPALDIDYAVLEEGLNILKSVLESL